ncbi:protein shisa-5 [Carettochelys insculpta]|uniref:protein shisa-5 n=1 Tax=Carettochelys insculpta TaxID=44489 RepID=UPI003EC0DF81
MAPAGGRGLLALGALLLLGGAFGEYCRSYTDSHGRTYSEKSCPRFCCGNCLYRYCCLDWSNKFGEDEQFMCHLQGNRIYEPMREDSLNIHSHFDEWEPGPSFATFIAIGVTIFVLFVVTIILCFTCSCCCLYKMCRRQQPVVTTRTATTTVVHAPYPQQPVVPPGYPAAPYQGYQPVPVQPQHGMPAVHYPTQYPPPYPAQPSGPPAYHETMAAGAGVPYPVSQPPYNPAYVDPQKPTY